MSKPMTWNESFFDSMDTDPVVRAAAEECAAAARSIAPVDTAEYRDSIGVSSRRSAHRTVFVVTANDDKATLIESEYGVLARAAARVSGG